MTKPKHDEHVIQMNEVHRCASGWVQRPARSVGSVIDETGRFRPATSSSQLKEETTMLKTISAALLAVSVLAAPALAAAPGKTTHAPVIKSEQVKPNVLNANAKMGRHHHRHYSHRHFHKRMGALKKHQFSKVKTHQLSKATIKHIAPATKRG
jgi:hypothetical protein